MSNFINDNFLLDNNFAIKLYHEYAINLPIIDYHSHLSPKDICNNRKFKNISSTLIKSKIIHSGISPQNKISQLKRLIKVKNIVRILETHNSLNGLIIENLNIFQKLGWKMIITNGEL